MSRRKGEITGHMNERDFPHLVELVLPPGGLRDQSLEFNAFHRERRMPIRRGRGRHEGEQFRVRFCFPDVATADAFRDRFGGERLSYASEKRRPRASKGKSRHIYHPRIVADHIMMQEDFERLHKFLRWKTSAKSPTISESWSRRNGRSWCISCRRRRRSPVYLLLQGTNKNRADNCKRTRPLEGSKVDDTRSRMEATV
jgi:hypothetical protein